VRNRPYPENEETLDGCDIDNEHGGCAGSFTKNKDEEFKKIRKAVVKTEIVFIKKNYTFELPL
jgi:hypothetical protein